MCILGYLGHLQSPDIGVVLPLHSLVPYQVKELFGMACRGGMQRAQLDVVGNSVPTACISQKRDKRSNLQRDCIQGVWKQGFCLSVVEACLLCVLYMQVLAQKLLCVPCCSASVCLGMVWECAGSGLSRVLSLN